jgi:hypothetical protein
LSFGWLSLCWMSEHHMPSAAFYLMGATTLDIMTLSITTCSKTTLRTTTISITKNAILCITSLSIKFHNAEHHYADCSYAEWRVFIILLNVVMLSVVVPFNVRYVSTRIRYYIIVSKYIWFRLHVLFIHGKHDDISCVLQRREWYCYWYRD